MYSVILENDYVPTLSRLKENCQLKSGRIFTTNHTSGILFESLTRKDAEMLKSLLLSITAIFNIPVNVFIELEIPEELL